MILKRYIALTLMIILLLSFTTFAQENKTGTIKGKTYQGAVVYIKDQKRIIEVNNQFQFNNMEYGKYKIKIVHEDYYSYESVITLDKELLELGFIELPTSTRISDNGSGQVYSSINEDGEIVVVPLRGKIKGVVPKGAKVSIEDKSQIVGDSGQFTFEGLKLGRHILTVNYQGQTINKEISVTKGEMVDLGKIEIESENDDSVDITEGNNLPEVEKNKEKDKKNEKVFQIKDISFGNEFTIISINYNRNIKGENYNRSQFSSSGIYDKFHFTIPITIKDYNLYFDSFIAFSNGGTGQEKFYLGDSLANYYMVDLSTNEYGMSVRYDYPFKYGKASASLGRLYYNHNLDKSTFGNSDEEVFKEYRKGKGWNFGGSFVADFSNLAKKIADVENKTLTKIGFGTDFDYTQSYVNIDSTKYFSSTMVEGNRTSYSFYLTYKDKYDIKAGYKFLNYNATERLEGSIQWPSVQMIYQGPFIDFTVPF